jgi:hypothetical protein
MLRIEKTIIKLVIIQGIFLLFSQVFLHHYDIFPELNVLIQYEGVSEDQFTKIIETFYLP